MQSTAATLATPVAIERRADVRLDRGSYQRRSRKCRLTSLNSNLQDVDSREFPLAGTTGETPGLFFWCEAGNTGDALRYKLYLPHSYRPAAQRRC
jgi:hypothetical protein